MLFCGWWWVLKLFEGFLDMTWHREMHLASVVVPVQCYANVTIAYPVSGDFVVLFKRFLEVTCMFFTYVFDSKVIHYQRELNRAPVMLL